MGDLTLPAAELPLLAMPPLCARTGRPATSTGAVNIVRTPPWAYLLFLLGIPGILIAYYACSRRLSVRLPALRGQVTKQSLLGLAMVVAFLTAFTAFLGVVVDPGPVGALVLVVAGALTYLAGRAHRRAWVRGRWVDEHTVRLTGLHPSFHQAILQAAAHRHEVEQRMSRAGWHPDPGGTPALRYFDGARWTEHLTPLPQAAP